MLCWRPYCALENLKMVLNSMGNQNQGVPPLACKAKYFIRQCSLSLPGHWIYGGAKE